MTGSLRGSFMRGPDHFEVLSYVGQCQHLTWFLGIGFWAAMCNCVCLCHWPTLLLGIGVSTQRSFNIQYDTLMTLWRHSEDTLKTLRRHSDDTLKTLRRLSDDTLMTLWWLNNLKNNLARTRIIKATPISARKAKLEKSNTRTLKSYQLEQSNTLISTWSNNQTSNKIYTSEFHENHKTHLLKNKIYRLGQ